MKLSAAEAFGLKRGDCVSLTGGGGKTSLLYALARENPFGRILCTTTTKMFDPRLSEHPFDRILIPWTGERLPLPLEERERCFAAAEQDPQNMKKVNALSNKLFRHWRNTPAWPILIVEADGAAHRPLKAPADHEPVIPGSTTVVIGCIGLDVLGRPLGSDWVHRSDIFSSITGGRVGEAIEPVHLDALIRHPEGLFKNCPTGARRILFLNKADALEPSRKIDEILTDLSRPGLDIRWGSLADYRASVIH